MSGRNSFERESSRSEIDMEASDGSFYAEVLQPKRLIALPQSSSPMNDDFNAISSAANKSALKLIDETSKALSTNDNNHHQMVVKPSFDPSKNKIKLFNSIRRYLSPTLMSLVRMQMFASSEYKFRADELQTAQELLDVSEDAYNFLRNEWMIPLPTIDTVSRWSKEGDCTDLC